MLEIIADSHPVLGTESVGPIKPSNHFIERWEERKPGSWDRFKVCVRSHCLYYMCLGLDGNHHTLYLSENQEWFAVLIGSDGGLMTVLPTAMYSTQSHAANLSYHLENAISFLRKRGWLMSNEKDFFELSVIINNSTPAQKNLSGKHLHKCNAVYDWYHNTDEVVDQNMDILRDMVNKLVGTYRGGKYLSRLYGIQLNSTKESSIGIVAHHVSGSGKLVLTIDLTERIKKTSLWDKLDKSVQQDTQICNFKPDDERAIWNGPRHYRGKFPNQMEEKYYQIMALGSRFDEVKSLARSFIHGKDSFVIPGPEEETLRCEFSGESLLSLPLYAGRDSFLPNINKREFDYDSIPLPPNVVPRMALQRGGRTISFALFRALLLYTYYQPKKTF